ncbi:MAG: PAS domain S-box protein [Deltaproteobacteria bacterium]|nr:PAS domain S-box protein [Deltaproteobacteria bacterium]
MPNPSNISEPIARTLLEVAPDALILISDDGRVQDANTRAEAMFGFLPGGLRGEQVNNLVPERLRDRNPLSPSLGERAPVPSVEHFGLRRDGTEFPIEVSLGEICREGQRFVAAIVRDATASRRTAATLRATENQFRLTFEAAPIGMALVGLDGRFLSVNKALCEIVGYSAAELTGLTFQAITHPDDLDTDLALADQLRRGEIPRYELGKRYIHKDGSIVHVVLTGTVVRDASGAPLHFIAQVEDVTEQIRTEETKRLSEQQVRDLIDQTPDGIFIADLEGRYTDVNPAACRLLGYAREELIGKTIVDLIPASDVPRLWEVQKRLLQPGQADVGEWTLRCKDGSLVPVEVSASILADGRWQAFVRDITERKRAELELRRGAEELQRAQQVAHLGSWEWDLRTHRVTRSPELFRIYGLPPGTEGSLPWAWEGLVHPGDRPGLHRVVEEAVRTGEPYAVEYRIHRPDGVERVLLQQGERQDESGQLARMVGTILDITELRRAEREREESRRWMQAVLDQSPVALIRVIGANGERVELNARAEELLGRNLERVAQYAEMVLTAEGRPLARTDLPSMRALRGERIHRQEYLVRTAAGDTLPVLAGAAPIRDNAGQVQGAVVAFEDISHLKELERLRAEWNSVIAHDLRQPISAIGLHAHLMKKFVGDTQAQNHLASIRSSARRLNRMIDDLLDLSRLEANRLTLERRPTNMEALARATAHDVSLQAPGRAIEVRAHGAVPEVEVDPDRMAQVLENLLTNAVKYGEPATPIHVDLAARGPLFSVAVRNRGHGISADQQNKLFRRFQRMGGFGNAGPEGIGLGLYITRALVEAHGGSLTLESTPGATTTFCATMPIHAEPARPATEPPGPTTG